MGRHVANGTTIGVEAALALAQHWGLSFPVRSTATERPRTDVVGVQRSPGRNGAHDGATPHGNHIALRFLAVANILRGPRPRAAHPLAGDPRRTVDLDPTGCVPRRFAFHPPHFSQTPA